MRTIVRALTVLRDNRASIAGGRAAMARRSTGLGKIRSAPVFIQPRLRITLCLAKILTIRRSTRILTHNK